MPRMLYIADKRKARDNSTKKRNKLDQPSLPPRKAEPRMLEKNWGKVNSPGPWPLVKFSLAGLSLLERINSKTKCGRPPEAMATLAILAATTTCTTTITQLILTLVIHLDSRRHLVPLWVRSTSNNLAVLLQDRQAV